MEQNGVGQRLLRRMGCIRRDLLIVIIAHSRRNWIDYVHSHPYPGKRRNVLSYNEEAKGQKSHLTFADCLASGSPATWYFDLLQKGVLIKRKKFWFHLCNNKMILLCHLKFCHGRCYLAYKTQRNWMTEVKLGTNIIWNNSSFLLPSSYLPSNWVCCPKIYRRQLHFSKWYIKCIISSYVWSRK